MIFNAKSFKSLVSISHFFPQMMNLSSYSRKKILVNILNLVTFIVFSLLDILDAVLCVFFKFVDRFIEGNDSKCYCHYNVSNNNNKINALDVSESLIGRKNVFRLRESWFMRRNDDVKKNGVVIGGNRWSDCGCEMCLSWQKSGDQKLYVVTNKETSEAIIDDCNEKSRENVIFIHGFLCSSSLWTETVYPNLSDPIRMNYKLFAIDLLGFGRSPKPRDCMYTLKDHIDMIDKSVIVPNQLSSFHLVAHSMGCIIALALAAKYSTNIKSITLIAPPYFPSSKDNNATLTALQRLAEKRLWPPLLFGSSVMSWYEHLGRCICFIICRTHRLWEWILKLLSGKRELHFMIMDLTRHTHHSGWHTMHNVICGGAKYMDDYLQILNKSGVKVIIMQGDRDQVVPLECIENLKQRVPLAEVNIIRNCNHTNVVLGREKIFTLDLERIWTTSQLQ